MKLMERQVDLLQLETNDRVVDLGSGLGAFSRELAQRSIASSIGVIEIDLIPEALRTTAREREGLSLRCSRLSADLSLAPERLPIPLADQSCSAALASLLVSYVPDPERLLRDAFRVLEPGGRIVISTLRRDADLSLIWAENEKALRVGAPTNDPDAIAELDESLRSFFNDASRLMLFEEDGLFSFWEPQELAELVKRVGFSDVRHELALGTPPQAVIVSGTRR
jgi:SAM-dependent methyltransferase